MARRRLKTQSTAVVRSFLQTMITLATASLGLVAALAWNDAIKALFKAVLGEADSVPALFIYATLATVFAIVVVGVLAWWSARVGGDAVIDREVEG
jgi:cytochrome b